MRLSILPGKFGSRRGKCGEEWKGGQHYSFEQWLFRNTPRSVPMHQIIQELDFRNPYANLLGKQRLIFLLREDASWPPPMIDKGEQSARIEALRNELRREHTIKFFENKDDLAARVAASVAYSLSTSQVSILPKIQTDNFSAVPIYDISDSRVNVIGEAICMDDACGWSRVTSRSNTHLAGHSIR